MRKIANTNELVTALKALLDYAGTTHPSRLVLAQELSRLSTRVAYNTPWHTKTKGPVSRPWIVEEKAGGKWVQWGKGGRESSLEALKNYSTFVATQRRSNPNYELPEDFRIRNVETDEIRKKQA